MRLPARHFALGLALVSGLGAAQSFVAESAVTFTFVASHTGERISKPQPSGALVESTPRIAFRITPADVLDVLVAEQLIPERRGWRIVAVWADWPDATEGYRFFVQSVSNRADVRRIPDNRLKLEILESAVARKRTLAGGLIASGSESATRFVALLVGDANTTGGAQGLLIGAGRYAKPSGATKAVLLPGETTFSGAGSLNDARFGQPDNLLEASLTLRAASAAPASRYLADPATPGLGSTGATTVNSGFLNAGLTKTGSGTLTVGSASSFSGAISISSVSLLVNPGESVVSPGGPTSNPNLTFGTIAINPGTLTLTPPVSAPPYVVDVSELTGTIFGGHISFSSGLVGSLTTTLNLGGVLIGGNLTSADPTAPQPEPSGPKPSASVPEPSAAP